MNVFDQTLSQEQLRDYQLRALNEQLLYAVTRSAFYNEHLRGLELPLRSLDALGELPTMTAADIIERGPEIACLPQREIARIVTLRTSGTTGQAKRLFFTRDDVQRTADFFQVGMGYLCGPGDRVAVFMPGKMPDGIGDLLRRGLEAMGAEAVFYGPVSDAEDAARFLRRGSFHTLVGIPSQMRRVALADPSLRPANVLLSADYVPLSIKELLKGLWHTEVFEHYGMTETCYGGAVDCVHHRGMHIRHDELIFEILDEHDRPLPPGETGQIAVTTLHRQAMPLIRYKTGDLGSLRADPCPCGSELPRLDHVLGRAAERAHRVNIHALDELLLGDPAVLDFTAELCGESLTVSVTGERAAFTRVKNALQQAYPELQITVTAGEPFATTGVLKRRLTRSE